MLLPGRCHVRNTVDDRAGEMLPVRWMPLFGVHLSRSGPSYGYLSPATALARRAERLSDSIS